MRDFSINILGLSKGVHPFEYHLDDTFFTLYGREVIQKGSLDAQVTLDKRETFIEARFVVKGYVELTCDRSLEIFQHTLSFDKKIVFKFGDEDQEVSDEIVIISPQRDHLEVGQFLYEFILLEVPMKKLHPRFAAEESDDREGGIIYSSSTSAEEGPDDQPVDPRWEALKKLK